MDNGFETNMAIKRTLRGLLGNKSEDKNVFIVSGAPGAGKTTYVMEHKKAGDLVVDMDLLVTALQGEKVAHPSYDTIMDAALAAREAIYSTIENRQGKWNSAFIVTANPDIYAVTKLANRLQGKAVNLDVGEKVCIERILKDDTRENKQKDIELVKQWYKNQNRK